MNMQNTNAFLLSQQEVAFPWSRHATFMIHSSAVYGIQPRMTVQLFKEPLHLNKNDTLAHYFPYELNKPYVTGTER